MTTPADRDRARVRVRTVTTATAAVAGVLTLVGAAAAAGTFAGRTVSSPATDSGTSVPATDGGGAPQPPQQAPGDGSVPLPVQGGQLGSGGGISSGGS